MPDRVLTLSDLAQKLKEVVEQFRDYVMNTPITELLVNFSVGIILFIGAIWWLGRKVPQRTPDRNKQSQKVESTIGYRIGKRVRRLFARDGKS